MSKKAAKPKGTKGGFDPAASKSADSGIYAQIARKGTGETSGSSTTGHRKGKKSKS
jgi:hypothetical protein